MSVGSLPGNDDSNDALVIVDDAHTTFPPGKAAIACQLFSASLYCCMIPFKDIKII